MNRPSTRIADMLVTRAPACVAIVSALVYFACSEGIRNHVLLLARAVRTIVARAA